MSPTWPPMLSVSVAAIVLATGCGEDEHAPTVRGSPASDSPRAGGPPGDGGAASTGGKPAIAPSNAGAAAGVTSDCGSVRMTQYDSSALRWCAFDRTHPALPDFVRRGLTVAIAEPYNGGSYDGDPGEACGECWEVTTTFAREVVMVHDLCPIEGNPICAGSHFHFDVSNETAEALGGGWLGEAAVRRVPCPVTGAIQGRIASRNEYGYLQVAFFNHRFPIRTVEYQPAGGSDWLPMERCLARWCVSDDTATFAADGPGAVLRFTNALGEVATGTELLGQEPGDEGVFDTGAAFAEVQDTGRVCEFVPPGDVYADSWGGIEGVRWEPNTWGSTELSESSEGCAHGSASCLRLSNFADSGLHITYRHVFPTDTYSFLSLQLRASTGGTVEVAPRTEDSRCSDPTSVEVDEDWTTAEIDVAGSCPDTPELHGLTISRPDGPMDLWVDEIRYE